jgi:hypothetical protein
LQAKGAMAGYEHLLDVSRNTDEKIKRFHEHLQSIITCLLNIEERLRDSQRVQINFTEMKRKTVAERLMAKADELIDECDNYVAKTDHHKNNQEK